MDLISFFLNFDWGSLIKTAPVIGVLVYIIVKQEKRGKSLKNELIETREIHRIEIEIERSQHYKVSDALIETTALYDARTTEYIDRINEVDRDHEKIKENQSDIKNNQTLLLERLKNLKK